MNIYLEIFGYVGTVLVILSMMMTSVLKLRIINICGGTISAIYSVFYAAWPVVIMNVCLIAINIFQIARALRHKKEFGHIITDTEDGSVRYFLSHYASDIEKYFPQHNSDNIDGSEVHMIFIDGEASGLMLGKRDGDTLHISLDYAIPKYRDLQVANYLFPRLKELGIKVIVTSAGNDIHNKYLQKLGFVSDGGAMTKAL